MKKLFIIFAIALFIASISGCSNKLEKENKELKQKIAGLEAKVQQLSETDQFYFNKAVDLMNNAVSTESKTDYQSAVEAFNQLIQKYPSSSYVSKAKENVTKVNKQILIITTVENGINNINNSISSHDYSMASSELKKLRRLIAKERYSDISQKIYDESNKPLEISPRDLKAEPMKYYDKRVSVGPLVVRGNNLERNSFYTYLYLGPNRYNYDTDVDFEVFYDNTPDLSACRNVSASEDKIIYVVGIYKLYNNDWSRGYIQAQKISIQ